MGEARPFMKGWESFVPAPEVSWARAQAILDLTLPPQVSPLPPAASSPM